MEKRVCGTCGLPRSKSSFACHYESHTEICHACKDFCIHRVKLAHSKQVTVHELFDAEEDSARLRRYRALTKAGVVWEQVARRQHSTRKRASKRRRVSTSSSLAGAAPSKPSAAKRRRNSAPSARRRARMTSLSSALQTATTAQPPPMVRTTRPSSMDANADLKCVFDDDDTSMSSASDSIASSPSSSSSTAPTPCAVPATKRVAAAVTAAGATAGPFATPWTFGGDFDEAVEALVSGYDLNASTNVDEVASVVAELDAQSPPLFDCDTNLDDRLLALDTHMLVNSLATCDWDAVPLASPSPRAPAFPMHA